MRTLVIIITAFALTLSSSTSYAKETSRLKKSATVKGTTFNLAGAVGNILGNVPTPAPDPKPQPSQGAVGKSYPQDALVIAQSFCDNGAEDFARKVEDTDPELANAIYDQCGPKTAPQGSLVQAVQTSFRSLPVPKPTMDSETTYKSCLLQIPLNLYAHAKPAQRATTLLGYPLQIRATPKEYRWTITNLATGQADGDPIITTSPGASYFKNNTVEVGHTFHYPGRYRITLAVTYTGAYSLDGGATWTTIPATITTHATPHTITAEEYRNYLINDPDEKP